MVWLVMCLQLLPPARSFTSPRPSPASLWPDPLLTS